MTAVHRLTEKERIFLAHAGVSAEMTLKEISKRTGLREHAVRYTRDTLISEGYIRPVWLVDMYRLGYTDLGIFFTRGTETSGTRKKFEEKIQSHPSVTWFAKMGGGYQYGLTLNVRKMHDVEDFYAALRPTETGAYFKKTVRVGFEWYNLSPTYLYPEVRQRHKVILSTKYDPVSIDAIDAVVIQAVATQPGASLSEMARAAAMSVSTFTYRFDKLRELGIINSLIYTLDIERLGIHQFRLLIVDRGLSKEQREQLLRALARHPGVVAIILCTGSWDFEVRFETETVAEVDAFAQMLYDEFGFGIDAVVTIQQFRVLKRRSYPAEALPTPR
jgi:DNA-binding Lrp family transcriptional regulator